MPVYGANLIEHVHQRSIQAHAFKHIPEYFGGSERSGGRLTLRTHPDVRGGFYFILILGEEAGELPPGAFVLELITEAGVNPVTHRFRLPPDALTETREVLLGLTGPKAQRPPALTLLAWRVRYEAQDGVTLGHAASFLWPDAHSPGKDAGDAPATSE